MNTEVFPMKTKERTYPYLGKLDTRIATLIVLFTSHRTGTVIHIFKEHEKSKMFLGKYCDHWVEPSFELFDGTIALSN